MKPSRPLSQYGQSQFCSLSQTILALSLSFLGLYLPASAQVDSTSPVADALNGTFGKHDGKRASHAKGFCANGDFTPAPRLDGLVASPFFAQQKMDATLRFSIGGRNPGLTGLAGQDSCDALVFMPVTLPAGMAPSDDSILAARAPAYAVSLGRRAK